MSKQDQFAELEALTKPITKKAIERAHKLGSTRVEKVNDDFLTGMLDGFQPDELIEDTVIAPPQPTSGMFYGMVGEVARTAANGTEINPVSAALVYLSFIGVNVSGDSYYRIGNKIHHSLLFTLHIGRSGRGRKGDSQQLVHLIRKRIEEKDSSLLGNFHGTGLSSREGLATLIHDGFGESPAIADKRLWINEDEFSNTLSQSKREGNTLSSAIRESWDGGGIKPATKSKPVGVSNPLIGIHANITPTELNSMLSARDMSNGFANRFLMIWAEKTQSIAYPKTTPESVIEELANQTIAIIRFAKGGYPNKKNSLEMHLSQAARNFWSEAYMNLDKPLDSDFLNGLLERRAPYAIRLAMVFALTDQTHVIEVCHIKAALEWIGYSVNTVKYVFADKANNRVQGETRQNAARIMEFLKLRPLGSGLRDIANDCFQKNSSGDKISQALCYLLSEIPPKIIQVKEESTGRGRPKTKYLLKNSTDKLINSESRAVTGFSADLPTTDKLRTKSPRNGVL